MTNKIITVSMEDWFFDKFVPDKHKRKMSTYIRKLIAQDFIENQNINKSEVSSADGVKGSLISQPEFSFKNYSNTNQYQISNRSYRCTA